MKIRCIQAVTALLLFSPVAIAADVPATQPVAAPPTSKAAVDLSAFILTPPPPHSPRINGPSVFGVRPGHPLIFAIPATGDRPMNFKTEGLPPGISVDPATGQMTGVLTSPGNCTFRIHVNNTLGSDERMFKVVVGDQISLTPAMGWNSWNCWASAVDQEKVLTSARAMVSSGLSQHGWTYINIDDTWQGARSGELNALQADPKKFPDMEALCDDIHKMGLKAGIYSTPWVRSYAGKLGGSAENEKGDKQTFPGPAVRNKKILPYAVGKYSFAAADAKQWALWGFDYLKYDWNPIETPQVQEMNDALKASGRDFIFSLSNSAPFAGAADWARLSNSWRTTNDIRDNWGVVSSIGFSKQDAWTEFAGPGHWNDPDMLVVGYVGWGPKLHQSNLTADEQYTHISLWCLLSAPLLIGCDLDRLDPFTLNLLSNDEVLAIDQDELGKQARHVVSRDNLDVFVKELSDGTKAVGLFNRTGSSATVSASWSDLGLTGAQTIRDLWRQKNLGTFSDKCEAVVPSHGTVLVRISPVK